MRYVFKWLCWLFLLCLSVPEIIAAQKGIITSTTTTGMKVLDTMQINPDKRFALVIGNEEYSEGKLRNPVNDAKGIEKLLTKYGFKVTMKTDLDLAGMDKAVSAFSDTVSTNRGIGLFYYSGHGMQYNSRNFLLPLQCKLKAENDIGKETIQLDSILKKISYSKYGLNIVVLDACRNNPFYDQLKNIPKGLTYSLDKTRNTLIFFATSANDVADDGTGENSPFTSAFINVINKSDSIELMQIAKQVVTEVEEKTNEKQTPQYVGTISKDFFFKKTEEKSKPKVFVLSIGISRYKNAPALKFSSAGAKDFAEAFKKNTAIPYDASNSYYLIDEQATRMNILSIIYRIKQKASPGDLVLVYYSGRIASELNETYLLTYETEFKEAQFTGIADYDLLSILSKLPCKSLLFLDGTASEPHDIGGLVEKLLQPRNNVIVFTSSGSTLISDGMEPRNSLFTYAIIRGLESAQSKDNPGYVDVQSLSDYVKENVYTYSKGRQIPLTYFPKGWQNFIIAKIQAK